MNTWTKNDFDYNLNSGKKGAFYLYTPLCGTCQIASKMLQVVMEINPNLLIGKADLNYIPNIATEYEIESVPCLILFNEGKVKGKIYAFQSVPYLLEKLR
ncbi:thioredoxin family protein [Bacillus kwashiorkori]|uniref:thioredoxin family protein n=1 Tax=Bacillus kwashiorkori TaxID=1522318 RepID=UPI0007840F9C|nr:thioredoxin family protein [Bacillus kwashiorkori]